MKKTKKLLLVALLMFLVAAATGGAYAYWAGSVNTPTAESDVVSVKVGEAKALATELTLNSGSVTDGKYLVPTGQLANSTLPSDAPAGAELKESIVVTYQVDWEASGTGSADGATGTLTAEVDSSVGIKINDNATSLISVAFAYQGSSQSIVLGTTKTVTVTITMSEPANKTEYDAVINQPITIPIKFSVAPA